MYFVAHGLSKRIAGQKIIDRVELELEQGSITAILGSRYSGKTLLLKLLAGLEKPDSGEIFIQGEKVTGVNASDREIGLVFDKPYFFEHLNMYQNLKLVFKKQSNTSLTTDDAIRQCTDNLDFSHLLMSLPKDLTPIQLFTAQLARALLNNPMLILIDDPFEQVDGSYYNQIRLLIKRHVTRDERTIIVTTRFADQAQLLANQLVILDGGRTIQSAKPEYIYKKPANLHVAHTIYTHGLNVIPARIKQRYKRFIDCIIGDGFIVRVSVNSEAMLEYDRDTIYLCLTSNNICFDESDKNDQSLYARLIAVEKTELYVCSHWSLDRDTFLETHTEEYPKVAIGASANLFFSGKECFIYSKDKTLIS